MKNIENLKIKIFADGADIKGIADMNQKPWIKGFTTNPTLMRKSGITDYETFAKDVLAIIQKPISFEVFADDFAGMERQAKKIASWGSNVYVKIPVTNTKGESAASVIRNLAALNISLNVTAVMTLDQVRSVAQALGPKSRSVISVFAGRIADTGIDPIPLMQEALKIMKPYPGLELLWASPREILNICQADEMGCHIITVTNDLLNKAATLGKDLSVFSLETVKMFYDDATKAGFSLETK